MEHRAFCLYLFAVVNILKYSIVRKMPAVAGSKKGKKTTEAKAATVEEKEESQLQVRHVDRGTVKWLDVIFRYV